MTLCWPKWSKAMTDVLYAAGGCFALILCWAFAKACERL